MNLREVMETIQMAIVFAYGTVDIPVPGVDFARTNPPGHVKVLGIRPDDQVLLTSHVPNNDADLSGSRLFCPFVERIMPNDGFVIFIFAFKGNTSNIRVRVDWAVLRNHQQPG